jgi:glycosyltransferase involved in cell wall biosynthesis
MSTDLRHKTFLTVSVVVPVYNSGATLTELVNRLHMVLSGFADTFEIILVNDGSHDHSWQVIRDVVARYPSVRGIDLMRNYGQHNALLAGIRRARYEIIVTIDDDLQHPPEEIPKLLTKLSEGYDIVYGKPAQRNHSAWRNVFSKMLKTVLRIVLGSEMAAHSSAFRAFRSGLRRGFDGFTGAQLSLDVLLSWSAARVTHVPVKHCARRVGKSGYTFGKLMLLSLNMVTGYSILPLRLASGLGLTTSFLGFLMFLYVVIRRLLRVTYVPGSAFLASEVALLAGLQLFAIGVIGEYVARLHFRTMGKPPYSIRVEVGNDILALKNLPCVIQEASDNQTLAIATPVGVLQPKDR